MLYGNLTVPMLLGAESPYHFPLMILLIPLWRAEGRVRRPRTVVGAGGTMFLQRILLLHFPLDLAGPSLLVRMTRAS